MPYGKTLELMKLRELAKKTRVVWPSRVLGTHIKAKEQEIVEAYLRKTGQLPKKEESNEEEGE